MMKHVLLAVSVLALTSGGVFAQGYGQSPGGPSPTMPPPASSGMPGPGPGAPSSGAGTMGQAPHAATMGHSTRGTASAQPAAAVKQAQATLKQQGLYQGKVDGKLGPQTKAAIAAFQKQNGLKQTAHLDRATMSELKKGGGPTH
ncbi:MAG: peptidoglycan-binding protein [Alphaproteobacteria bacterium]|nr:peptidoglycan-binding protein [Alphaproteobacteria bacterium]